MKPKSLHLIVGVVITLSFAPTSRAETGSTIAAQTHVDRALSYYNRGNLTGAISELRKARDVVPNDPHVNFMLGNALYRHGEIHEAAKAYAKSLEVRPSYFEAHMSRGFALFELRRFDEAVIEWRAAKVLDPKEPFARTALAVGLYAVGRVNDAKVQYAEAVM